MLSAIPVTVADTFTYPIIGLQEIIRRKSPIKPFPATEIIEIFRLIKTEKTQWVVLTDEFLKANGIDSITTILKDHPSTKICVLTASVDVNHLHHLLSLGVRALIHKSTRGYEIKEAILRHPENEIYYCPVIAKLLFNHTIKKFGTKKILSDRQVEIIPLLIKKMTRQEIADALLVKISSIHTQCGRIYIKQKRYGFPTLLALARADGIII